jgi:hypothetical protein
MFCAAGEKLSQAKNQWNVEMTAEKVVNSSKHCRVQPASKDFEGVQSRRVREFAVRDGQPRLEDQTVRLLKSLLTRSLLIQNCVFSAFGLCEIGESIIESGGLQEPTGPGFRVEGLGGKIIRW